MQRTLLERRPHHHGMLPAVTVAAGAVMVEFLGNQPLFMTGGKHPFLAGNG